ncbi:acetyl-CoA synthetase-like protein [Eremomyces bilateralis CBS 781.70]|uniref:Acetyl-CoA synthetase-like protein n=1 Tax=Eremomyces bilateralis CBS 781.70 TaxID=1392243 RepID=A0A6G1GH30_9PEZI|nr:acetyl-CoA synthetase-like protein [Eremomyces bilateralis CBS 781.70]KAF1817378.1 acetyl-CoA synthetase-like protein [Eremomyces bilateralis CBS 781.70]
MASTLPHLPIFEAISKHDPESVAIVHSSTGQEFRYGKLLQDVVAARNEITQRNEKGAFEGERIAFLMENSYAYVVTILSIFACNAIAVPLSPGFPGSELRYILEQSQAKLIMTSESLRSKAPNKETVEGHATWETRVAKDYGSIRSESGDIELEHLSSNSGGLMLYTSGTTNRPKGVLLPQSAVTAQSQTLLEAWKYSPKDYLLHILPLHHIHGLANAVLTPLFAGSTIEFMSPFSAQTCWERIGAPFTSEGTKKRPITFFTAVPTIYTRLLESHPNLPEDLQQATRRAISPENLRLNISGSAALPTPVKSKWTELSGGNVLLERYGMTEIGMGLSCGLDINDRVDGSVGWPFASVEARLVDTDTKEVIPVGEELGADGKERQGEIQIRGPMVFKEYWRNPEATATEFTTDEDGKGPWFKTGDVAVRRVVESAGKSAQDWAKGPMYFIQGRQSADIIKTGGEKVSALEVEREMLSLPQIAECAVVALPSDAWGQKVAAVVVLTEQGKTAGRGGKAWSALDLRRSLKDRLVNYKIPQEMKVVESIPKNAMGKINKKMLVKEIFPSATS